MQEHNLEIAQEDLNELPTAIRQLIFELLVNHTDTLENTKQYLTKDVALIHRHIIRINDVAYKYFNV